MQIQNGELLRLKETERLARERLERLAGPAGLPHRADVMKAAKELWAEAEATLRAYRDSKGAPA